MKLGIPVVHGSIFRFEGMVTRVRPEERARPTATWCPSRRRPSWPRRAPRPACSACCPASSARIQALETIKLILGLGDPLIGRILSVDTTEMEFRTFKLRRDPANEVTWDNRDRIIVQDLEGLCAPGPVALTTATVPPDARRIPLAAQRHRR